MVSSSCQKSWKDGSCCCNCENWYPLHKHPWNKLGSEGHGPSSERMAGFVCVLKIDEEKRATYYQHDHGMCEFHSPNPERARLLKVQKAAQRFGV